MLQQVVVDQPTSTNIPLQTISQGVQSLSDFEFLEKVDFLKARPTGGGGDCCGPSMKRGYNFVDHEKNEVFQMVEDLSSKSGLLHTLRNNENQIIGQVRYEIEENFACTCCSSYSFSTNEQIIHVTSSGGFCVGTIAMKNNNFFEVKNGVGEVIMVLIPKRRFLSKTTYPIVTASDGATISNVIHGLRSTSIKMQKEFIPAVKVMLAVLIAWMNVLKQIEDSRSTE